MKNFAMKSADRIVLAKTFIRYKELSKAQSLLRDHLAAAPEDVEGLLLLAQIFHRQGNKSAAGELYERVYRLDPPAMLPAPYVVIPDFLSHEHVDKLFETVNEHRAHFEMAQVSGKQPIKSDHRNNLRLRYQTQENEIKTWFDSAVEAVFPLCCAKLNIPAFEITKIEFKISCYPHGSFFRIHRDDAVDYKDDDGQWRRTNRRLSFVYYFHRQPKRYQGGDLLLHHTDRERDFYLPEKYTRIVPQHNSLVCFPSCFYHQVTDVNEPTRQFMNGRFTINGHLSTRVDESEEM